MGILDRTLGFIERTAHSWRHQRAAGRAVNRVRHHGAGEAFFSRVLSSLTGGWGWPGMWARERLEYPQHFRHWTFVAVDRKASAICGRTPTIAWVEPEEDNRHQKEWFFRQHRFQKTLGSVHPHEKITPVPASHPLMRLCEHPNEWDTAGLWDILYQTQMYLDLCGEAYWWIIPDKRTGLPCEWWVIPSHWCWVRMGQNGIFQVDVRPFPGGGSGTIFIPWDQIVYFQKPSPLSKIGGWSPQRAGSEWSDNSEAICQSQFWAMKNGLNPQGAIELGEDFHEPSDEDLERYYIKFFLRFQGEYNHGKPIILPPGAKFTPLEIMPKEMMFNESAEHQRDNILALFGVPKQIAGLSDAGSDVAMWGPICQFHEQSVKPALQYLSAVATKQLCHRWDSRLRMWWDNPTDSSPEQRRADMDLMARYGAITTNELRSVLGYAPMSDEEEAKYSKLLQRQGGGMPGMMPGNAGGPVGGQGGQAMPVLREWYVGEPGGQPPTLPAQVIHTDHHMHDGRRSWSGGVTLKSDEPKRYGYIMYPISPRMRLRLTELAHAIDDADLAEKGRQEDFHVTVLYGLGEPATERIAQHLEGVRPFDAKLLGIEMFADVGEGDVLFVKVDSDDLHALHHYLLDRLPCLNELGSYYPHITLAYVKTGRAQKYTGASGLEDETLTVDRLVYSSPEKVRHPLTLAGAKKPEGEAVSVPAAVPQAVAKRMRGSRPLTYRELVSVNNNGHVKSTEAQICAREPRLCARCGGPAVAIPGGHRCASPTCDWNEME